MTRMWPSFVTRPISTAFNPHFAKSRVILASRPRLTTSSIRSWDSESRISYGLMPSSRHGTRATSISTPEPPREAVSQVEQVSPAAPMS